jgi:nifR3 family TIM-barrel protein
LFFSEDEHPIAGQVLGAEPDEIAAAALRLVQRGFDVVDVNFGCPVKKVLGKRRGGFHLGQPWRALEIVQRTRDAVPDRVPVTVKLRRGIDDSPQSRDMFWEILEGVFAAGVAAVTVHPRTVTQRYTGRSCWPVLAEAKRCLGERTILGSGDLFSAQDCVEMLRQTGVDGVSVARGAIGNPWIYPQIKALLSGAALPPPPDLHEQRAVIGRHYRLAEQLYGAKRYVRIMRKFGVKYAALHPQYVSVRDAFVGATRPDDWQAVLQRWYAHDGPGCYRPPEVHKVDESDGATMVRPRHR